MRIFVTGSAGFIGTAVCLSLIKDGHEVIGYDCAKHTLPSSAPSIQGDIRDREHLHASMKGSEVVIHLAAKAQVADSFVNPSLYHSINIGGFQEVVDGCLAYGAKLIYASTSCVYSSFSETPFHEKGTQVSPKCIYGFTKRCNEELAKIYSVSNGLWSRGLRLFTVYGPRGRADMAIPKFIHQIYHGKPVTLHDGGKVVRDFAYIDDVIHVIKSFLSYESNQLFGVYNVSSSQVYSIKQVALAIGKILNKEANLILDKDYPHIMPRTEADLTLIQQEIGDWEKVTLEEGLSQCISATNELT